MRIGNHNNIKFCKSRRWYYISFEIHRLWNNKVKRKIYSNKNVVKSFKRTTYYTIVIVITLKNKPLKNSNKLSLKKNSSLKNNGYLATMKESCDITAF